MKNFKIFATLFAVLFLFAGVAFATDDVQEVKKTNIWGAYATVNPNVSGGVGVFEQVSPGNEYAGVSGGVAGSAENLGAGGIAGFGSAWAKGIAHADGFADGCVYAKDWGTTSVAAAFGVLHVDAFANGASGYKGYGLGGALNKSTAEIEGKIEQTTTAQEIGYGSGTFAQATEKSGASFYGKAEDCDLEAGFGLRRPTEGVAESGVGLSGNALVGGGSIVNVDPYGYKQSAFAATGSFSLVDVNGADCAKTSAWGSGKVNVGAFVEKGTSGAAAYGNASYGYSGTSMGAGAAYMKTDVSAGPNSFSATAKGGAFSTNGGFSVGQPK